MLSVHVPHSGVHEASNDRLRWASLVHGSKSQGRKRAHCEWLQEALLGSTVGGQHVTQQEPGSDGAEKGAAASSMTYVHGACERSGGPSLGVLRVWSHTP